MSKQKFFVNEDELDNFQVQLLQKRIDRSTIVSGCAGSGKSILALWKAKQIQDLLDDSTYQFIVFTKALNRYMLDGIRAIGLDEGKFLYYHEWRRQGRPSADFIIVDEIQDFDKEEIAEFKLAARRAFFFWGDSAQSIYRGLGDKQDILAIAAEANIQPEQLVFNHRLPRKVARFAAVLSNDEDLVQRCRKEGAEMPRILRYNSLEQQLDVAMEQIKNRQMTDVAIMFPTNIMVQRAYDYLIHQGYSVEAKYEDRENYRNSRLDLDFDSDNPKLMTYHSSKGLQFEAVILPECTVAENHDRTPLYVAITRSYQFLFIMYSTTLSPFFDVIPKDLYVTKLEEDKIEL
ncbi:MAG: ATP-binding domain-containing protein [Desulfobulbaceae bacterium]|nr:ATP-binding domain-containing protein [Desulfobulbaceae bacterium]